MWRRVDLILCKWLFILLYIAGKTGWVKSVITTSTRVFSDLKQHLYRAVLLLMLIQGVGTV